jgi:hypothetical protein
MNETMKLFIQFDDAPIEVPFARIETGNISSGYRQHYFFSNDR